MGAAGGTVPGGKKDFLSLFGSLSACFSGVSITLCTECHNNQTEWKNLCNVKCRLDVSFRGMCECLGSTRIKIVSYAFMRKLIGANLIQIHSIDLEMKVFYSTF
jgi:hypothetical protein